MTARTRSRLDPDQRRQQIVEAARTLYSDRAYVAVSTRDLAEAAGVARGLVHHYFGGKRGVYLEVVRQTVMMPRTWMPEVAGLNLIQRVDLTIDWILDAATTYGRPWINASGSASMSGDSELQQIFDAADDRAAHLVLQLLGLETTDLRRTQLRAYAGMVKATCREWLIHRSLTRTQAHAMLSRMLVHLVEKDTP